jgi:general stress protein 26
MQACEGSVSSIRMEGLHFESAARDANGDLAHQPMVNVVEELSQHFWFTSEATARRRRVIEHRIDDIRVLINETMCAEYS